MVRGAATPLTRATAGAIHSATARAAGQRHQGPGLAGGPHRARVGEHLGVELRVQDLLRRGLVGLQLVQAVQLGRVVPVQAHDLTGRLNPPPVGRGVVAERGQQAPGPGVAQRRGIEEHAHVAGVLGPVVAQDGLEVADPHVVGDHGQVVAPQPLVGELQVADRAGQRGGGIEALVDAPTDP
jgi:hypothetical protein